MKLKYLWVVILLITVFSCKNKNNTFDETQTGLEYRFVDFNKDAVISSIGDVLAIDLIITNEKGDTLFNSFSQNRKYLRVLKEAAHQNGSIEDALSMMHLNDSAVFRIDAYNFYKYSEGQEILPANIKKGEKVLMFIKLNEIIKSNDYSGQLENKYHDSEETEMELLQNYLQLTNITKSALPSGLYYVKLEDGNGKRPAKGSIVKVHYSGAFIDGKPFETSYDKEPYKFLLGSGNVIQGWEEGIAMMQEGEKARLIIPSKLAYGAEGRGEILPYSTLIFDVELISVQ